MELRFGIIRNGALGPIREWKLKECITIHKLLETGLVDHAAASSKQRRSLPIHVSNYFLISNLVIVCIVKGLMILL